MSEKNKRIKEGNLIYLINEEEMTASVINEDNNYEEDIAKEIFIPRFIKYYTKEYLVTSISTDAFNNSDIKSVQFAKNSELSIIEEKAFYGSSIEKFTVPPSLTYIGDQAFYCCEELSTFEILKNSKLQTIKYEAFAYTLIESLTIPSSLINLDFMWCADTSNLIKISVSPNNPRYKMYEDKILIGKSSIENNEYDVLVFCPRDIENITIPNFIKCIGSCAFYGCNFLEEIEISADSELQTIDNFAFACSSIKNFIIHNSKLEFIEFGGMSGTEIESFTIPPSLKKIYTSAFSSCRKLRSLKIPDNSQLCFIGKIDFSFTSIESLTIPSSLTFLEKRWCYCTSNLIKISVSPNNPRYKMYEDKILIGKSSIENNEYDVLVFCPRDIENITIPNFIKCIGSCAFNECNRLKKIEISADSELQTIEEEAFMYSSIVSLKIPPHLKKIERAFSHCKKLRYFEI